MLSASVYKLLHFLGIFMVLMAIGAALASSALATGQQQRWRKLAGLTHGIGLLIVLVAGFGLLARQGLGFELWVMFKLLVWLALGGMIVLIRRSPQSASLWWWATLALALFAAYLGHYQPF